jgi:lipoyl(octanoyl) transferase
MAFLLSTSEAGLNDPWRLILPQSLDGPRNMAVDEAILTLVGEGHSPPTLRFYEWLQPWVSIGSGQSASDLDVGRLAERQWGTVRRASGGTAVVHLGQLGYAIVLPIGDPVWQGDLISSYARLSGPFRAAFASVGAIAQAAPPGENRRFTAGAPRLADRACFGAVGPYELVADGRKLLGNSQIRRRHAATQHGVIQVFGGQSELAAVVAADTNTEREQLATYLASHVSSISERTGHRISTPRLCDAIVTTLVETLAIQILPGALDDREGKLAEELLETKYANPDWTSRR